MTFDGYLVLAATWALLLGAAWALLVLAAAVVEVASDGRLALTSRLGCPAPLRRTLLTGLGVVLASGGAVVAVPVSAAPAPLSSGPGGTGATAGLPVPARPTGSAPSVPRQSQVVVEPGDSLWRLARHRSPGASTPDLARIVERTYAANRRVIGPDPDLIHPGQRLRVPAQRRQPPTSETR